MKKIEFTKMVASGNDFIIVRAPSSKLPAPSFSVFARRICDRKYGAGADGLIVLGKSKKADLRMRIFNADGSEAEMCGNGARCVALWAKSQIPNSKSQIETKAGIIQSKVNGDSIKIKLTDPRNIKLDIPVKVSNRVIKVNFINTGVPHAVIFTEGLDKISINGIARAIRYHRKFAPAGTNVDFAEVLNNNSIKIRTYERGVEDETLACGTGSVASALIFVLKSKGLKVLSPVKVETRGKEVLKVYFKKENNKFKDIWLEGKAGIVYKGVYYV